MREKKIYPVILTYFFFRVERTLYLYIYSLNIGFKNIRLFIFFTFTVTDTYQLFSKLKR